MQDYRLTVGALKFRSVFSLIFFYGISQAAPPLKFFHSEELSGTTQGRAVNEEPRKCNSLPQELIDRIYSAMSPNVKVGGFPLGGMISISLDGKPFHSAAYGSANNETGEKAKTNTLFRMSSNGKAITALAILKQVEEGKYSLDTALKNLKNPKTGKPFLTKLMGDLTVRQLLNMTSGIKDYYSFPGYGKSTMSDEKVLEYFRNTQSGLEKKEFTKGGSVSRRESLSNRELKERHFRDNAISDPWEYSNASYVLLGKILEHMDGKARTLPNLIKEEVFAPLGMTHTQLWAPGMPRKTEDHFAEGYTWEPKTSLWEPGDDANDATLGDGSVWTNAVEWGKMDAAFRTKDNPLGIKTKLMEEAFKGVHDYGFGWNLYSKRADGVAQQQGHSGGSQGFSSYVWRTHLTDKPDRRLTISLAFNYRIRNWKIRDKKGALPESKIAEEIEELIQAHFKNCRD